MSSQNQVSACNLALLSIGARAQISALSDGSVAGDACATLFSFVFEHIARGAKWSCLNKQATLTLIQAAQGTPENPTGTSLPLPQQPYQYAYLYPPDCLMMQSIAPPITTTGSAINQTSLANNTTPWIPGQIQIPYEVAYSTDSGGNPIEVILTNQENAVANYTVNQQNPSSWDSTFTSAFVAALGAYLVPALSLNPPLMQQQIAVAEKMLQNARSADGNESPVVQDIVPDWIRARSGSTGFLRYSGYGYPAYNNIPWPVC